MKPFQIAARSLVLLVVPLLSSALLGQGSCTASVTEPVAFFAEDGTPSFLYYRSYLNANTLLVRTSSRISLSEWTGSGWAEDALSASRETVQDLAFARNREGAPALLFSRCRGIDSVCAMELLELRAGRWNEETLLDSASGADTAGLEGLTLGFLPDGSVVGTARNSTGTLLFVQRENGTTRYETIGAEASALVDLAVDDAGTVSVLFLTMEGRILLLRGGFGAWQEIPIESFPGERSSAIAMALEADASLRIAYPSGEGSGKDLRLAHFDGQTVTYETIMPTGGFGVKPETFSLLLDGAERFLLFSDYSHLKLVTFTQGAWTTEIVTDDPDNRMRNATLARAPSGDLLVGYSENRPGTGIWTIYAARKEGSSWKITVVDDDERP